MARALLPSLSADVLVAMDRNFAAFKFLWDVRQHGAHFLVRIKRNMRFRTVRRLGPGDRLVRVRLHAALRRGRPDLPAHWVLREITYTPKPGHESIRLLTSVVDPILLSAGQSAIAYGLRWGHETELDEYKTHLMDRTTVNRPVVFRSMEPTRVEQELYGMLIAHNALRVLMHRAALASGRDELRLSPIFALERLREAIRDMMGLATPRLPERFQRLLKAVASVVVPRRPKRSNPREVKIKMSSYPCKMTRLAAQSAA
jgi:hypothetical protein